MRRLSAFILFLSLSIISVSKLEASAPESTQITVDQSKIKSIEQALNRIANMQASFHQFNQQGEIAKGTFYLSRPGKIRWEYNTPSPIVIVGKGSLIAYFDKELDEVSYIGLEDVLAGLLTKDKIQLSGDIKILSLEEHDHIIYLALEQKDKPDQGQITLLLDATHYYLKGMSVKDTAGAITDVFFDVVNENVTFDAELFNYPRSTTLHRSGRK